jgi:plasmid stabilization system protein ParE
METLCWLRRGPADGAVKGYRFLPLAREEVLEVSAHYEDQAVGLGSDFLAVLESAIALLRENSELGAPHRAGTHRFVLPRFPHSIIYFDEPEAIVIVALAHHRRDPGYGTDRI